MHKEAFLPLNDGVGHPQDRVEPLLDVLDEPACFLQPLLQGLAAFTFVRLECTGVNVVHPQPGHHLGVEPHLKTHVCAFTHLLHDDVGHHNVALHVHKTAARFGLQPSDQQDGGAHHLVRFTTGLHQPFDIAPGEHVHGLGAHRQGGTQHVGRHGAAGLRLQVAQLQLQAFRQRPCAHTRRLQVLQQLQRHRKTVYQLVHLFHIPARQTFGQGLE